MAVLLDNKQPVKTFAWLLVLITIPVVGVILYYFFGQNLRRKRLISKLSLDKLGKRSMIEFARQENMHLHEQEQPLIQLFWQQSMALPFQSDTPEIFTSGSSFYLSLLNAIGKAEHHIHIETFIIANDAIGNLIADALIDKAQQGVEVRFIYDDVGCWDVRNKFFERMREGGVEVNAFMPVKFPAFTSKANYRNHRKLCVIDGKTGYIGGMNIAMRYIKGTSQPWRDTHLKLTGNAVYGLQNAFLTDWYFTDRSLITSRRYYPDTQPITTKCLAQTVTSSPTTPWPSIMQGYVRILLQAKHYVYMETPYFLPTEPILSAIHTAALSGIDVRLMVPMKSDSKIVELASRTYLQEVISSGVKVYFYTQGFNHSKLLVSDDFISTCGSTNIDFRSFEDNFEANIFFYDHDMAMRMKEVFLQDQATCTLIDQVNGIPHRPFLSRLWESIVRLLSPLL